ncbi:NAD(P)H-binding protein [Pedobacter jeongneungensis]|uniref:NAD(P)H-binding protein n=1 Tax=Pedobacter jeongneungensis TaxID=947309 RepID=UPI00046AA5D2|nr:NAD(P)H-binding protein [Pedobacter jeongneungensis]
MKKVIIIGATGSLAKFVIEALQTMPDVQLTLFVRDKTKLDKESIGKAAVIEGDVLNYADLEAALSGQDIVYENLAGDLETMTENIVKAMKENGVKRIIAISAIGIYEVPLKPVLVPYRKLADVIEASKLDYTILRPDWFTYGNEVEYGVTKKGEPEKGTAISRKSIADFVARLIENPDTYIGENLGISKI